MWRQWGDRGSDAGGRSGTAGRRTVQLALAAAPVVGAALYLAGTGHWTGWMLLYVSFVAPLLDPELRASPALLGVLWGALALHHVVAVVNAFWFVVPGAEMDAATFHIYGTKEALEHGDLDFGIGSDFYILLLAVAYKLGGISIFYGEELSIAAFTAAAILFIRILALLEVGGRAWWLALFGLLPSLVIFSSITLRESFELALFMLGVYGGLRMLLRPAWWAMPVCAFGFLVMGLFHQLLLLYSLWAMVVVLCTLIRGGGVPRRVRTMAVVGSLAALGAGILLLTVANTGPGNNYVAMARGGAVKALIEYRGATKDAGPRTEFHTSLEGHSVPRFLASAAVLYVHYMLEPFLWNIERWDDLYAALESLLRAALLISSLVAAYVASGSRRRALTMILVLYFSMTALWALGTTNYGQAIRHHMLTNWLLIAAGAGPVATAAAALWQRRRGRDWG